MIKNKNRLVIFISVSIFISAATLTIIRTNNIGKIIKDEELTLEQLRALPYISYTEEKADRTKTGVMVYDRDRAFEGYNLYGNHLMDMEGNIVHSWLYGYVLISDNGYIFARNRKNYAIGKYTWDSTPIWKREDLKLDHEIILTPDNTILIDSKEVHEYMGRRVEFDLIVELDQDGNELSRWSTWDNLNYIKQFHKPGILDKPATKFKRRKNKKPSPFGGDYDYYHLNSIQALPENPLGEDKRFQKGNWLISLRYVSLVLILDKDTKEIVWSFGPEEIRAQHMPRMLDNGNILIFDNGGRRKYTRIIELNPVTKEIVWVYKADPPESFFSGGLGSAQRLPNGNTLIGDSKSGHAFEVTKEGEIVWEWFNPDFNEESKRGVIYRMRRYPKDKIEKILKENRD